MENVSRRTWLKNSASYAVIANLAGTPLGVAAIVPATLVPTVTGVASSTSTIPQGYSAGVALGPILTAVGANLSTVSFAMAAGQDSGGQIAISSAGALLQGLTPISAAGSFNFQVVVTPAGGLPVTSAVQTVIAYPPFAQTFALTNGSALRVLAPVFSTNHQFGKSAIPVGSYPAVYDSTGTTELSSYQIDHTRAWESDGSLRRAVISAAFTDSYDAYGGTHQTRSYMVKVKAGSRSSTPNVLLSDIAAQDIKLLFSGFDCGSDIFQCRVNDIIANGAAGVYVGSLVAGSSTANSITFPSLTTNITGSDGVVHPFTATKGMQISGTNITTGTYVASVSGNAITLSANSHGSVTGAVNFSYPVYGYEVTKSGPICSEWRFWSRLTRVSDGAVHRYVRADIILKAWAKTGQWEIRCLVTNPNCNGPHPTGSTPAIPAQAFGGGTFPTPRFVSNATLQNGTTVLASFGGINDFRTQTVPASTFSANNTVAFPHTRLNTASGFTDFFGVALSFSAASGGTLPSGVMTRTPYWLLIYNYGAAYYLVTSRYHANQASVKIWATSTLFAVGSWALANNVIYYTAAGGTTASSGGGPSTLGTVTDGTVTWTSVSVKTGTAGSGNLIVSPAPALYANTSWVGADPTGAPIWWHGSGSLTTRPNLLFGPAAPYFFGTSKAVPPFDLRTTAYKHTSMDYAFDRSQGVTWQNTYGPNSPPTWGWAVNNYGDDPGDERVGDISNNTAWLFRRPDDPKGAQQVRTNALCFADGPYWYTDERSGYALVGTMGPARKAAAAGGGSDYPGLGYSSPDFSLVNNFYPTANFDTNQNHGYVAPYGVVADAQHWPRPWYGPAVLDGDPLWAEIGIACANAVLLSSAGGNSTFTPAYNNGIRHYKSTTSGKQYSGLMGLDNRPRAMAWGALAQMRLESFLPDGHVLLPVWKDIVDDTAAAYVDFYITTGAQAPGLKAQGALSFGFSTDPTPYINQQYMNSFFAGVWAQEIWKEQDNGRRTAWATFVNKYYRKSMIDLWDSDISRVLSEYYMAVGTGYGGAYINSDSHGDFFTTAAQIYTANGWSTAYPNGPPSTNIGTNDPAVPGGAASTNYGTFEGIGNYPFDAVTYYTLALYHLNWLTRAGIAGASTLAARVAARISGQHGITWSLPNGTQHWDNNNAAMYVTFNITPS